jgi:hypothetical protein
MDPNETLLVILRRAHQIIAEAECRNNGHVSELIDDSALVLAEHVVALDEWIGKGGFLPERWKKL